MNCTRNRFAHPTVIGSILSVTVKLSRAQKRVNSFGCKTDLGTSYTGELADHDGWRVEIKPPMQIASRLIAHSSFQGFRYVRPEEKAALESAFAKQK